MADNDSVTGSGDEDSGSDTELYFESTTSGPMAPLVPKRRVFTHRKRKKNMLLVCFEFVVVFDLVSQLFLI